MSAGATPRLHSDNGHRDRVSAGEPGDGKYTVRVVFGFRRAGMAGTNTQAMSVTTEQVAELRRRLREHP